MLGSSRDLPCNAVLAPSIGLAALLPLVCELCRRGVPVRIGGPLAKAIAPVFAGGEMVRALSQFRSGALAVGLPSPRS